VKATFCLRAYVKFSPNFLEVSSGSDRLRCRRCSQNFAALLYVSRKSEQCFSQGRQEISVHNAYVFFFSEFVETRRKRSTRNDVEGVVFLEDVIREGRTFLVGLNTITTAPVP